MKLVCPKCGTPITKDTLFVNVDFVLGIPIYSKAFGYKDGKVVEVEEFCEPDISGVGSIEFICKKCNSPLESKELHDIYEKVYDESDCDYVAAIKAVYESLEE